MIRHPEITSRDWFVNEHGQCQPRPSFRDWDLIRENYYLHRFLTEIEDLILQAPDTKDEWDYLPQIRMRVRQLIINSYWVRTQYLDPCPKTGASVLTLYDEIGYPLTVQTSTFAPGTISPIHNHGTWGVVAVIKGREKHTFWRRTHDPKYPDQVVPVGEMVLHPGEIISFVPQAIHQVEAVGTEPTITFHLYGDTQPRSRFQFDPETHIAKPF